jgi:hypothetical protein
MRIYLVMTTSNGQFYIVTPPDGTMEVALAVYRANVAQVAGSEPVTVQFIGLSANTFGA